MRNFIKVNGKRTEIDETQKRGFWLNVQMAEMKAVNDEEKINGELSREDKENLKKQARESVGKLHSEHNLPREDKIELGFPVPVIVEPEIKK